MASLPRHDRWSLIGVKRGRGEEKERALLKIISFYVKLHVLL